MHRIKCSPSSGLEFFANAITPIKQNVDTMAVNTLNISTRNWVVVKYNESFYAGEVAQVLVNDIEVSAMENWPKQEDKVFYNISEAIKVDDDELRESEKFSSNFVFDESDVFQNASWNNFPKSRSKPGTLEEKIAQIREERRQKKLNKPPKIEKDVAEDEMEGGEKEESQEQNGVLESETEEMAVLSSENEDKDDVLKVKKKKKKKKGLFEIDKVVSVSANAV
ncbi:hypothetical protein AVEN_3268-1 [Araneus ventricosus]|uniref:Uncharacterized protein n=1 Tax=Araneus ventricosus TaxID=182803 RepID=A0A4Y2UA47_ARAVE|nr:hypothetical protein AVEN_3268-1 [Araneus ventricosus]